MHNNDDSSMMMMMDRKRKRRDSGSLRVRFCPEPSEIIDTYSPFEYNRSGLFPDVFDQEQEIHDQHISNSSDCHLNNNIIWTFSFGFTTPTTTTTNSCYSSTPATPLPVKKNKGGKKKPKLSIDTSIIQDGPLYFSKMTTNHQKKKHQQDMPLMTATDDDDRDARITMENTEINRRCLVAAV